ncbi:hypothetical protein EDD18DRAFT_1464838 [Armillaria luteobubalina]|uniref:Uncharacterized protein n=1 Tax=Armillaria luteobubalina TaxID=153913 RepID=A0AA39PZC1_9AGAR|nr:hypothetical protein EDD18DRAFT_1464838 [Armillaria luteobubalina]
MPEQQAHALYTKLLLSRGHGYPLWIPEPDYSLSSAYVERGICVGDVGIIRSDGGFDFIFNAFLEADNPVNACQVPPNFSPLRTESDSNDNPIHIMRLQHPKNSFVTSPHVSVTSMTLEAPTELPPVAGGGAEFEFSTSKDQAAFLMLPQGATRFDIKNLLSMRNYALEHAREWYEYINGPNLGREVPNGTLYFVTGCDKTTAWESAAISKPSDLSKFSTEFLVGGLTEGRMASSSSWSTNGWTNSTDAPQPENQAVFIRGFTISVREKSRIKRMLPGWLRRRVSQLSRVSGNPPVIGFKVSDQRGGSPLGSAPAWANNGDTIYGPIAANELTQSQISSINAHMQGSNELHQPVYVSGNSSMSSISHGEMDIPGRGQLSSNEHGDVVLQDLPGRSAELLNPSVKFNEYILSTVPESDVVVTHDNVWMSSMLEESLSDSSHQENIRL